MLAVEGGVKPRNMIFANVERGALAGREHVFDKYGWGPKTYFGNSKILTNTDFPEKLSGN